MIAIEGNVASGKSTLIKLLKATLRCPAYLEPVEAWSQQLESFYREPSRYGLPLQLKVLTSFLRKGKVDSSLSLIERSPLSSRYVFGVLLHQDGLLSKCEYDTYEAIYDAMSPLIVAPQRCIYIYSDPGECFIRAGLRGRSEETNLNSSYLEKLHNAHEGLFKRSTTGPCKDVFYCDSPCYQRVVWINGSRPKEEVLKAGLKAVAYLTSTEGRNILNADGNGETREKWRQAQAREDADEPFL
jgi:deoxyadenosine/deoxycytidine kinase